MERSKDVERKRLVDRVLLYHEQTKHRSQSYARSLGRMDWATQPNPFRHYPGARLLLLPRDHSGGVEEIPYDQVYLDSLPPWPLSRASISTFLYYSLALSAWKQSGQSSWSLRVNPSSGNLHPTEAYILSGPIDDLSASPIISHYDPYHHGLEERMQLGVAEWNQLASELPEGSFVLGLTSIHWRESWKYGERAYRYCQLDLGHALGSLHFAAMMLGWELRSIESLSLSQIDTLLGVHSQQGCEKEHAGCLLAVVPRGAFPVNRRPVLRCNEGFFRNLQAREWKGLPNTLSSSHHDWPILDFVREAIECGEFNLLEEAGEQCSNKIAPTAETVARSRTVNEVVRGRRSAVAMDGETWMETDDFYQLLWRLHPQLNATFFRRTSPGSNAALLLFVHRVRGLEPGLYLFCRTKEQRAELAAKVRDGFEWSQPAGCPTEIDLRLLKAGDFRESSQTVSCHQAIAADGAFSAALLLRFSSVLEEQGPGLYPRLFWEASELGQVMYLEAEAAGLQSTGIGCFLDDGIHQLLGITDESWQSLYHFAVGQAVEDDRVTTWDAYHHMTFQAVDVE